MKLILDRIKTGFHSNSKLIPSTFKERVLHNISNNIGAKIPAEFNCAPQRLEMHIIDRPVLRYLHQFFYKTDDNVVLTAKVKFKRMLESPFIPLKEDISAYKIKYKEIKEIANGNAGSDTFLNDVANKLDKIAY